MTEFSRPLIPNEVKCFRKYFFNQFLFIIPCCNSIEIGLLWIHTFISRQSKSVQNVCSVSKNII